MIETTISPSFTAWTVTLITAVPPGMWYCFWLSLLAGRRKGAVGFLEASSWLCSPTRSHSMDQETYVGILPAALYVYSMGLLESLQDGSSQDFVHHQTFISPYPGWWTTVVLGSSEISLSSELVSKVCVFPFSCVRWPQPTAPQVPLRKPWRNVQNILIVTFWASSLKAPGLFLSQGVWTLPFLSKLGRKVKTITMSAWIRCLPATTTIFCVIQIYTI